MTTGHIDSQGRLLVTRDNGSPIVSTTDCPACCEDIPPVSTCSSNPFFDGWAYVYTDQDVITSYSQTAEGSYSFATFSQGMLIAEGSGSVDFVLSDTITQPPSSCFSHLGFQDFDSEFVQNSNGIPTTISTNIAFSSSLVGPQSAALFTETPPPSLVSEGGFRVRITATSKSFVTLEAFIQYYIAADGTEFVSQFSAADLDDIPRVADSWVRSLVGFRAVYAGLTFSADQGFTQTTQSASGSVNQSGSPFNLQFSLSGAGSLAVTKNDGGFSNGHASLTASVSLNGLFVPNVSPL